MAIVPLTIRSTALVLLWVVPLAVLPGHSIAATVRRQQKDDAKRAQFEAIAKRLSSGDEEGRRAAIRDLIKSGNFYVPEILDLFSHTGTAIPCTLEPGAKDSAPGDLPCFGSKGDELLTRNRRLRSDLIYVLGSIRAVSAVPVMISDLALGADDHERTPEMWCLIQIGSRAVPELLEALYGLTWGPVGAEYQGLPAECWGLVRSRIVTVLGDIGDRRALPLLQNLRDRDAGGTPSELDRVIQKILDRTK